VDSGYKCAQVPKEGTYYVSVNERIEMDISWAGVAGCGIDKSVCVPEGKGILKWISPRYSVIDTGGQDTYTYATFLKAVKKGEETITITLENTVSYQYHIVVR
jgi:hypothetical protein